jgi:putative transposase
MAKHHSEEEILEALGRVDAGETYAEICSRHRISRSSLGYWKRKYAGLQSSELRQIRELRDENSRLRDLVASLSLERKNLKDELVKKL